MFGLFNITCPNCGQKVSGEKNFCKECGSYIVTTSSAIKTKVYSSDYFPKVKDTGRIYVFGYMLDKDEYPIVIGGAGYYVKLFLSLGGFLMLSNKRLLFHAMKLNIFGEKYYNFPIEAISDYAVVGDTLEIVDTFSKTNSFTVSKPLFWRENIQSVIDSLKTKDKEKNNNQKDESVGKKSDFIPPPPLFW